jgi:tRNA(Arg) A34 adenosine deaminase TadA
MSTDNSQDLDQKIMRHLLAYNREKNKYSPFAACLVDLNGKIISYGFGYNPNNPAHHAETDAISQCALKHNNVQWQELTMYSTGEPCVMCSSACCWVNVKRIVYGTDVPFISKLWNEESSLRCRDIINASPNKPQLTEYICQKESDQMFLSYKELYSAQPKDDNAILS